MRLKRRTGVLVAIAVASASLAALPGSAVARDLDRDGVTWRWAMLNDGVRFARGTATTKAPSGEFEIRRFTANGPGADRIVFRAKNPATGEVCRAVATI